MRESLTINSISIMLQNVFKKKKKTSDMPTLKSFIFVFETFLHLDCHIDFKPCTLITMKYNLDVKHTL